MLGVVCPLGVNFDFFSQLGFDIQTNSDHETQKIKLNSVRALKRCVNEKNLIDGQVMVTISEFSQLIFEPYFSLFFGRFCLARSSRNDLFFLGHIALYSRLWVEIHRIN